MAIIRVFRCWEEPDILKLLPGYSRESPSNSGVWGEHTFICEEDGECDVAVVFNRVGNQNRYVTCPPENIWQVIQEPFVYHIHDWMIDDQDHYSKVFTHYIPSNSSKYIRSNPMLSWYIDKTYDELIEVSAPEKSKDISWISSNKKIFPGHGDRLKFLEFIQSSDLNIDLFGSGINFIENKWDGMIDYRYSLTIENTLHKDYWTEKLADSYLSYCLPIYFGCPNITDYFPEESFIRIDIRNPEEALKTIRDAIENNEWEKRLPAIIEARELVLHKYNLFAQLSEHISQSNLTLKKSDVTLPPYKRTNSRRLKNKLLQFQHFTGLKRLDKKIC
ncbi:glycosyltransferase family 10 domain-containing protein [Amphritea sp.]|uniref:glycosyltransferase family 10 domain-containing protein n=1 Tax=Amphritea sp. TaxID=1872502 RepID=UPI003D0C5336